LHERGFENASLSEVSLASPGEKSSDTRDRSLPRQHEVCLLEVNYRPVVLALSNFCTFSAYRPSKLILLERNCFCSLKSFRYIAFHIAFFLRVMPFRCCTALHIVALRRTQVISVRMWRATDLIVYHIFVTFYFFEYLVIY